MIKPGVEEQRDMPEAAEDGSDDARGQWTVTGLKSGCEKAGPAQFFSQPCDDEEHDEHWRDLKSRPHVEEGKRITI